MTAPEREALDTGLDSMARQIESALDYDVAKRRQEGLETTPDTHLMSPPFWPSHGCLRYWIKALDEARKLLSASPAVTVTEEMQDHMAEILFLADNPKCVWAEYKTPNGHAYNRYMMLANAALKSTTPQTGSQE